MTAAAERRRLQSVERVLTQTDRVVGWVGRRTAAELTTPTRLPGWDVGTLAAHLLMMLQGATVVLQTASPERPLPLERYLARYRLDVDDIARRTAAVAESSTDLVADLRAARDALAAALAAPGSEVVAGWRGPLRTGDFLASRLLELVVHADDIDATDLVLGAGVEPVGIEPAALAATSRTLTAVLEERYPGRTIEVRVPPYAAVQCGTADHAPSPAHTRGTPPNVVEIAPLEWVRLATGRRTWADAVADAVVRASGTRADLAEHLPLLS